MRFLLAVALTLLAPVCLGAQMTVSGRVLSGDQPVAGASVSVPSLNITTRTNADGRYSFLVRAAYVRGQTVPIVARHGRYGSQQAQLTLVGAPVVQDFTLTVVEEPTVTATPTGTQPRLPFVSRTLDSSAFLGAVGPVDVASALAGRFPGLLVTSAGHGGSSQMLFRGARSLAGPTQPLVVIDGVALESSSLTTAMQQFGVGGFDYGTPLADIALDDIATVTLVSGSAAVPLYGSRAAAGVLFITTKAGGSSRGLDISGSMRFSGESVSRLPAFQNRYGQGLGGQFEFFDGQGGGINDAVDQSWGPALDGQPIAQASLTQPRRPDVRHWLSSPSSVGDYFESGRTLDANVTLTGTRQWASGRAALNARDVKGLTPNATARRLGLTFSGTAQPTPRVTGRATLQYIDASAENRPGTGFDEVNPVSGFTRMGRQVDLGALREPVLSGTEQLNWIYTARNNPFFQSSRNSNDDARTHLIAGGVLHFAVGRGLTATLNAGLDDNSEDRNVDVAAGWRGTYPTIIGRRDFSGGGTERQTLAVKQNSVGLALSSLAQRVAGFDVSGVVGAERRNSTLDLAAAVADTGTASLRDTSSMGVTSFYVMGSASHTATWFLDAGARFEQSGGYADALGTAVFPSVALTYDAVRSVRSLRPYLGAGRLHASLWRAGNEISRRTMRQTFAGGGTMLDPALGVGDSAGAIPERTTGLELGTELATTNSRAALDLTWYREQTREVLFATPTFSGQTAAITNRGLEAQLRLRPLGEVNRPGASWQITASVSYNSNSVDELMDTTTIALSPSLWGVSMGARSGQPVGVIVGTRYLRDNATNALVLRNGLPIADASGVHVLGSTQPKWMTALQSVATVGPMELSVLVDARRGGQLFSATNLWGSYAGTLESTLAGRESGLVIAGLDSVTGTANQDTVSTEDYFHALGAIHEAWVFDASYWKLRELRVSYAIPLRTVPGFREHTVRASVIGRNLVGSAKAPNISPESALSTGMFRGFEMGQLPETRSLGLLFSIAP